LPNSDVSAALNLTGAQPTSPDGKRRAGRNQTLGQDEFLKLLTTQLKAQDPLKPVEDTQFIAQMAQFSSLNQMQLMNQNFQTFNKQVQDSSAMQTLAQASLLIGKVVSAGPSMRERAMGTVQQVRLDGGHVKVVLKGVDYQGNTFTDKLVDLDKVLQVGMTPEEVKSFEDETMSNLAYGEAAKATGRLLPGFKLPEGFSPLP
jgi:flagellar basal-body rod modification protein FlgD